MFSRLISKSIRFQLIAKNNSFFNAVEGRLDELQRVFLSKISWDELFIEYEDIKQEVKYQKKLSNLEKKELRLKAAQLDREKRIGAIYMGRPGLTTVLKRKIARYLETAGFAKIHMVPTCDLDQLEIKKDIEEQIDCLLVCQMGYDMIFYRQKGLPVSKVLHPRVRKSSLKDEEEEDKELFT